MYSYDWWGNSLGKTEAVSNPWQFASGYLDATTGLYKFGTRYYSPTLGRWTQKDPVGGSIGKVGSGNAYVYANNAPVMMTDPSGRDPVDCFLAWLTLIGVAVIAIAAIVVAITTIPVTLPTILGLAPVEWALVGAGIAYLIGEAAAWAQFYHGACE